MTDQAPEPQAAPVDRNAIPPSPGEVITSLATGTTYTMGEKLGEGSFGVVFACSDGWGNDLAAKVLKPIRTYDEDRAAALGEMQRLLLLRHPYVTYVYDAFEYRDTFYIITERCYCPLTELYKLNQFNGTLWLMPIARCLLQAIQYLHVSGYAHQDVHPGNVFAAFSRDEMAPAVPGSIHFKLGDLGVSKVFGDLDGTNTLAEWIKPPEAIEPAEYGPLDRRIDIYHCGLLLLQLALSQEMRFSRDEILAGRPREMALALPAPFNFALEKALRRHAAFRTGSAEELWRDLNSPAVPSAQAVQAQSTQEPPA